MKTANITAVAVTRGGYDISEVVESLKGFGEVIVQDNSKGQDYKVWGRYLPGRAPKFPVMYVQDDDCIVDSQGICNCYGPGVVSLNWSKNHREVNANIYRGGMAPVGWGAVFDADLRRVLDGWERDDLFLRECDRVFTALNKINAVEVPMRHLPRANDRDRMWREPRHLEDMEAIRQRIQQVKKKAA